ncbi:MAG TPA: RDD family protein [Flavobacterium sp.]|nr:RDD family protein [Flavobacterium sp.]
MNLEHIVQKNKADKGLRFVNLLIDLIFFFLFLFGVGFVAGLLLYLINPYSTFFEDLGELNPFLDRIFTSILIVFYYFGMETLTKGRTIGKFITGTKVVTLEGELPTANIFLKRSLCRIIPFETFSFLGDNGWHDSIPKTTVVVKKHFDYEVEMQKNVAAIGTIEE